MDKKLGKIVVDGQLIDLDNTPIEKLEKLKAKLDEKEKKLREEIDKILSNEE